MKKVLLILAAFFVILIFVIFLMWGNRAHLLANMIGNKLGVPVYIEGFNFKKDKIIIDHLEITNPPEAKTPFALKVEKITITAPFYNYFRDPIVIDKVLLQNIFLNIEFYTKNQEEGNWVTLVNNTHTEHKAVFSAEHSLTIRRLHLTDIDVNLVLAGGKLRKLTPIDELTFKNVTSEKGIPTHELTEIIVQNLMNQVFVIKGLKTVFAAPKKVIEGLFSPFMWFDNKGKDKKKEASEEPVTP